MFLKIYLFLVSHGYNQIKKLHYGVTARKKFFSHGLNYRYRDSMTDGRIKLFNPYLYNQEFLIAFLKNMDKEGVDIAMKSVSNIKTIAQNNYSKYSELYDQRIIEDQKNFSKYVLKNKGKYFQPFDYLYLTNDYYINTLDGLSFGVNGKDILDCGAFIGDTAIPLAYKFPKSKIHAFEPEMNNYNLLLKTIAYNKLENNIFPIKLGVGDKNLTTTISNGGAGAKVGEGNQSIEIVTIDSYTLSHNIITGMIKRDIEGFEYESIQGAEKTIKRDKPVLIISLYHRGKDFFEIKPLLESWNLGYKFTVRKRNCFHPFADTVLICY